MAAKRTFHWAWVILGICFVNLFINYSLGIFSTGYGLGFATMGAFFPWIVTNFSWRCTWFFLAGLAFAMAAVNGIFLRNDPIHSGFLPFIAL